MRSKTYQEAMYGEKSQLSHLLLRTAKCNIWRKAATCDVPENCSVVLAAVNLPENPRRRICNVNHVAVKWFLKMGKQSASCWQAIGKPS